MRNIKYFTLLVICIISCQTILGQKYMNFSNCETELDFKRYFEKNILELDPLEGIYAVTLGYETENKNSGKKRNAVTLYRAIVKWPDNKFYIYNLHTEEWLTEEFYFTKVNRDTYYHIDNFLHTKIKFIFKGYNFDTSYEMSDIQRNELFTSISKDTKAYNINEWNKTYPTANIYKEAYKEFEKEMLKSSGTGFFIHKDGYIITNYHVVKNANNGNIKITCINKNSNESYHAEILVVDKQNDLAILKITDKKFVPLAIVPYTFKFNISSIGEDCFVLGYPLISSMGKDIKLTNGIISSKTGYDGNVSQYQISAPIQAGNSGGPLFDKDGNIIGVVQAKHTLAENAGYAIKASYIRNLIELLPTPIVLPQNNLLKGKTLPQQVELASKAVCIIIVNGD